MSSVAFPLLVLALTGSPAQAGLVGFAGNIPFVLLGLPAGALVDRVDRKRLMLVSDAVRALALATIPIAYAFDALTLAQLMVVAFVEGTFFILFDSQRPPRCPASSRVSSCRRRSPCIRRGCRRRPRRPAARGPPLRPPPDGSVTVGLMLGLYGAGSLLGSALAPSAVRRLDSRHIVVWSLWVWTAGVAALALVGEPLVLGAVVGLCGFPLIFWNVVLASYRYALVPDRLLGRVQSAGRIVAWSTIPLGALAGGLLAESLGARTTIVVLAAVQGAVALAGTLTPAIRRAQRLEELSAPAASG